MKLFLRDDVSKLGRAGDLVDVADGYARNFLLPRGLAYATSVENEKRIKAEARRRSDKELARVESVKELATLLDGRSVTIKARANEEQKLFGSIGPEEVAEAIRAEHGAQIGPEHVVLDDHIRELGVFDVAVHLGADIQSTVKVWVVQEG